MKEQRARPAVLAYTVRETAEALGISENGVFCLLKTNALRRVHLGRRTVIAADNLKALLESGGARNAARKRAVSPAQTHAPAE
jgi:hypothetical protein